MLAKITLRFKHKFKQVVWQSYKTSQCVLNKNLNKWFGNLIKHLNLFTFKRQLTVTLCPGIGLELPSSLKRPILGPKNAAPTKAAVPPRT